MAFLSIFLALVLEQFRPLPANNPIRLWLADTVCAVERYFDAGQRRHSVMAWWFLVGGAAVGVAALVWLAKPLGVAVVVLINVAVLYLTLGFRQFSHPFTEIQLALDAGNIAGARLTLDAWMRQTDSDFSADRLSAQEISRVVIEHALVLVHRHVFAVFFWFVAAGAAGAVMYRLAELTARLWTAPVDANHSTAFGRFARQAFTVIDWLPVRLTAVGFAIVGNFEDAVYAWRQVGLQRDASTGILLAAGGGALGVRLGGGWSNPAEPSEPSPTDTVIDSAESIPGIEVEPSHLRSGVGLVWRSMVLWLVLLLLLSIAHWIA